MSLLKAVLVLAFGLIWLSSASAQTAPGSGLPLMGFSNETSASKCIGNPVTPLCAVETFAACILRHEWPLCTEVGYEPGAYSRRFEPSGVSMLTYHPYEVMETRTIRETFTPMPRAGVPTVEWQRGDVAVRLMWQWCPPVDKCVIETRDDPRRRSGEGCRTFESCIKDPGPTTYVVRRTAHRWVLVEYYYESRQKDLQGDFWNRK